MATMIFSVLALGFGFVGANTVLHNNGYEGVVVAIGEDVPDDPKIVQNLERMFREGSKILFEATRGLAYFREVTIVLPASWGPSHKYEATAGLGWLTTADLRVDVPHPLHGDNPYTLQPGGCGEPGSYIHLTPAYAASMYDEEGIVYGPPGKVLVHEWAHLRWGVMDEYGKHGTSFPYFYIGEDLHVHVTGCTEDMKGWMRTANWGQCHADESGMPDKECLFIPSQHDQVNGSLMNLYFLDPVTMFCDNELVPHNRFAPNAHNEHCNGRSVWEVITQHKDFNNNLNPSRQKRDFAQDLELKFDVIQEKEEKPRFVLLLDISGSMDQYVKQLYQAVVRFVRDLVPTGSLMSVVSFANKSRVNVPFVYVTKDREEIVRMLPSTYIENGSTGIGAAFLSVLQMVEDDSSVDSKGLMVVLITDGDETILPRVETVLPDIKRKGIIINTISFGPNATDSLEQWARETGGQPYYHSSGLKGSPISLDALLFDCIRKADSKRGDQLLQVHLTTHKFLCRRNCSKVGEVIMDSSVGRETRFTFTEDITLKPFGVSVRLKAPDGQEYSQENGTQIYQVDNGTRTITFNILEAMPGRWEYIIFMKYLGPGEVLVAVTSHPSTKGGGEAPIRVKTWISNSLYTFPDPLPIYAYVSQGYSIVLDANVTAVVVPPTEDSVIKLPLLDNGFGADVSAGDGIYSAFFTQFSANGRYSLSTTVSTNNRTTKLQAGYSGPQKGTTDLLQPSASAIRRVTLPSPPETLPDPKSRFRPDDLKPFEGDEGEDQTGGGQDEVLHREKIEAFTRFSAGGIFKVRNFQPGDQQPPGRVKDLKASLVDLFESSVTLTWTSPGDDHYTGTASTLELRYHESMRIDRHFQRGVEVTDSHLTSGDLTPRPAGDPHTIRIKLHGRSLESLEGKVVFFALRALDESGNQGGLSNVATAYFPFKKYARNFKEEQKVAALGGMVVLVALFAIIFVIIFFICSVKLLHVRKRKKIQEQRLEEGGLRL